MIFLFSEAPPTEPQAEPAQEQPARDNRIAGQAHINFDQGDEHQQEAHYDQKPIRDHRHGMTGLAPQFLKKAHQVRSTV